MASLGYAASCHQSFAAAQNACILSRNRGNAVEGGTNYFCQATLSGYELRHATTSGSEVLGHTYYSADQVSSCELDFEQETTLGGLVVAIDNDLAQAELDISNLQSTQANQQLDIDGLVSEQNQHSLEIQNLQTTQVQNTNNITSVTSKNTEQDSRLDSIDGILVTEQQRIDLIELDIGTLHSVNATQDSAIQFNELYIEGVEQSFEQFEVEYEAANAQTNSELQFVNLELDNITANTASINSGVSSSNIKLTSIDDNLTSLIAINDSTNARQLNTWSRLQETNDALLISNSHLQSINSNLNDLKAINDSTNARQLNTWSRLQETNTLLSEVKTAVEGQSFTISGENISIDNTGVETRLDNVLSEQQLQKAEMVRTADAVEALEISLTVDPSQSDDSYVNAVSQYLKGLWEQELIDYDNSVREAIEAAKLEDAGLDTTDIEIIGAQMTGWAAAQTCVDYTFNLGDASFPIYCVKTEPFRNLLAWAFYILTAFTVFNLIIDVRVGRFA